MNPSQLGSPDPIDEIASADPTMVVENPVLTRMERAKPRPARAIATIAVLGLAVAGLVAAVSYHGGHPAAQQLAQTGPATAIPAPAPSPATPLAAADTTGAAPAPVAPPPLASATPGSHQPAYAPPRRHATRVRGAASANDAASDASADQPSSSNAPVATPDATAGPAFGPRTPALPVPVVPYTSAPAAPYVPPQVPATAPTAAAPVISAPPAVTSPAPAPQR